MGRDDRRRDERYPQDDGPPPDRYNRVPALVKATALVLLLWGAYYMVANFRPYPGYLTSFHPVPGNLQGTAAERGRYYFQTIGCMNCHTVGRYGGTLGPDLTHVAKFGLRANFLHTWLADPNKVMPGATMPKLPLSTQQIDDITAYLLTLK